ncbi:MAG: VWA domain-containing protein, partial [Phycisphaerae bacterium]
MTLALGGFVHFETPQYLVLLATIPLVVALSYRSLAGLGPVRRWLAIVLRCGVIACMVLALAGAERVSKSDESSVIFVVDRSSSVPAVQQSAAFEFIKAAAEKIRPTKDRLGIIAFDGKSAVEQLPMGAIGIERIGGSVRSDQTNIAGALSMAMALFPGDASRRVVLLSDGNENVGQVLEEAKHFAAAEVPIDVVPLRYDIEDEIVFERLAAPATASLDETVNLQFGLRSNKTVSGKIVLRHNDQIEDLDPDGPGYSLPWTLNPGANRIPIPIALRQQGAHRFEAKFEPDDAKVDTIAGNNEGRAFTVVGGPGKILILTQPSTTDAPGHVESAQTLAAALRREKLASDVQVVGERKIDAITLLEYSLVILSNVPANLIAEDERSTIAAYVRDLGGGLIMVGGDDSFGPGGWMDTPIEDILPVSFDVKSKQQIPKGALALVMHACEIPQGNYWGERVAVAAVKTLSSRDLIGVLSYQWRGAANEYWDVPLQEVRDKTQIIQRIQKMQMGDLPDFEPLVKSAVDQLAQRKDAAAKHMIIISDFDPAGPSDQTIA